MEDKKSWNSNDLWEEELEILKSIINKTELIETTKWGGIVYIVNNKNVIGIGGFKNFFTIWFFNGVFLKDELNVLVNANEGVTKALRQWRFTSKEEINEKQILAYIKEAITNEKEGKSIKPAKKSRIVCDFLDTELDADKELANAFEKFTSSKQNEFLEYIETAKQEKTKLARFEKIKPMILNNTGLNNKYR
ncbi:YdeI/OmpD-associated family protein [Flavobacterium chungnamense]|uniref:YdeI/OmpD-associated family protein n=1 Tax=Flavobacterium chungnamense TaxID=706182 RepID=A0ABP7UT29_9FLAO